MKDFCYCNSRFTTCPAYWPSSWIYNNVIFSKTAVNFLEINRKHVLTAPKSRMIKNRVEKKKLEKILPKTYSFLSIIMYFI